MLFHLKNYQELKVNLGLSKVTLDRPNATAMV